MALLRFSIQPVVYADAAGAKEVPSNLQVRQTFKCVKPSGTSNLQAPLNPMERCQLRNRKPNCGVLLVRPAGSGMQVVLSGLGRAIKGKNSPVDKARKQLQRP